MRVLRVLIYVTTCIFTVLADLNLTCDLTYHKWDIVDGVKTCELSRIESVNKSDSEDVVSLNGNNTKMEDVYGFWVENNAQFEYVPRMIDSFLPNLRAIGFNKTSLTKITKFDLAQFAELETLVLFENRLEFLDGDLFEYNTKIKSLTLIESGLLIVNGAILKPLNGLTMIEFNLKKLNSSCTAEKCRDKRCLKQIISLFTQNCEFDLIYPGFKSIANAMKEIGNNCERENDV